MRYALINNNDIVENVVVGDEDYTGPDGLDAVVVDENTPVAPGWQVGENGFIEPNDDPNQKDVIRKEIQAARDDGDLQGQIDGILKLLGEPPDN